jgi:hypothetical protein
VWVMCMSLQAAGGEQEGAQGARDRDQSKSNELSSSSSAMAGELRCSDALNSASLWWRSCLTVHASSSILGVCHLLFR